MVEAGQADVVVVAYFDRLVRSLAVQREVVERIERAGGGIVAVDVGEVRADTASRWLSSTMLGMVAEYHRRVTDERTREAKRRAIAEGRPTFPNVPPGLRLAQDGTLEPLPKEARIVREAFALRAKGASVREVREFLRKKGIERSYHGVQAMLGSRLYLGELRFGKLVNKDSHPAIVDAATFAKVQKMRVSRGRRAKSERLLARLGVLRCGTCGAKMVVGTANSGGYHIYRCPPVGDCKQRVAISAEIAEQTVWEETRRWLKGARGHGRLQRKLSEAKKARERAEQRRDGLIAMLTGLEDVTVAQDQLRAASAEVEQAVEREEELRAATPIALVIDTSTDTEKLSLDGKRALIRTIIKSATVTPGRGTDRISVETFQQ